MRWYDVVGAALCVGLLLSSLGCGTILYPERRGQRGGRIDPGVAVLDGVGLLFFIIPGVIAFAVDFGNGCIYLPGKGKSLLGANELEMIRFEPKRDARASIERILRERTGRSVRLDQPDLEVCRLESPDQLPARFAVAAR